MTPGSIAAISTRIIKHAIEQHSRGESVEAISQSIKSYEKMYAHPPIGAEILVKSDHVKDILIDLVNTKQELEDLKKLYS
jgi:hypothetical protein